MTPVQFLAELRGLDVVLWIDGDRLRYSAPCGVVTPERVAALRAYKEAVVAFLRGEGKEDPDPARRRAGAAMLDGAASDEAAVVARIEGMPGLVRCFACGFERNAEIPTCPVCHPAAGLPQDCLARVACSVLRQCERHGVGRPCRVAADAGVVGPIDRRMVRKECA